MSLSHALTLKHTHSRRCICFLCLKFGACLFPASLFFSLCLSYRLLPPLSLSSPLKLIFSFKHISLWQRCDWGCVFNHCVHWGPESASLTLYLCVWSLWVGEGSFTGYLLSVLDEAERVCVCEQSLCVSLSVRVCVCVVVYRCFSRTERESGKTETVQLIRALRGPSAFNQNTHVSITYLHPLAPTSLPPI